MVDAAPRDFPAGPVVDEITELVGLLEGEPEVALYDIHDIVSAAFGDDGKAVGKAFRDGGGVGKLVKLLQWWNMLAPSESHLPEIWEMRQLALLCLGNLCSDAVDADSWATKRALLEAGGEGPLLACLQVEDVGVVRLATATVQNLGQDPAWCHTLVAMGTNAVLEELLGHDDASVVRYASGTLRNMQVASESVGLPPPMLSTASIAQIEERKRETALDVLRKKRATRTIAAAVSARARRKKALKLQARLSLLMEMEKQQQAEKQRAAAEKADAAAAKHGNATLQARLRFLMEKSKRTQAAAGLFHSPKGDEAKGGEAKGGEAAASGSGGEAAAGWASGALVTYTDAAGAAQPATVKAVHPGGPDDPTPFYTISLEGGGERETEASRLTRRADGSTEAGSGSSLEGSSAGSPSTAPKSHGSKWRLTAVKAVASKAFVDAQALKAKALADAKAFKAAASKVFDEGARAVLSTVDVTRDLLPEEEEDEIFFVEDDEMEDEVAAAPPPPSPPPELLSVGALAPEGEAAAARGWPAAQGEGAASQDERAAAFAPAAAAFSPAAAAAAEAGALGGEAADAAAKWEVAEAEPPVEVEHAAVEASGRPPPHATPSRADIAAPSADIMAAGEEAAEAAVEADSRRELRRVTWSGSVVKVTASTAFSQIMPTLDVGLRAKAAATGEKEVVAVDEKTAGIVHEASREEALVDARVEELPEPKWEAEAEAEREPEAQILSETAAEVWTQGEPKPEAEPVAEAVADEAPLEESRETAALVVNTATEEVSEAAASEAAAAEAAASEAAAAEAAASEAAAAEAAASEAAAAEAAAAEAAAAEEAREAAEAAAKAEAALASMRSKLAAATHSVGVSQMLQGTADAAAEARAVAEAKAAALASMRSKLQAATHSVGVMQTLQGSADAAAEARAIAEAKAAEEAAKAKAVEEARAAERQAIQAAMVAADEKRAVRAAEAAAAEQAKAEARAQAAKEMEEVAAAKEAEAEARRAEVAAAKAEAKAAATVAAEAKAAEEAALAEAADEKLRALDAQIEAAEAAAIRATKDAATARASARRAPSKQPTFSWDARGNMVFHSADGASKQEEEEEEEEEDEGEEIAEMAEEVDEGAEANQAAIGPRRLWRRGALKAAASSSLRSAAPKQPTAPANWLKAAGKVKASVALTPRRTIWPFDDAPDSDDDELAVAAAAAPSLAAEVLRASGASAADTQARLDAMDRQLKALEAKLARQHRLMGGAVQLWRRQATSDGRFRALCSRASRHFGFKKLCAGWELWLERSVLWKEAYRRVAWAAHHWHGRTRGRQMAIAMIIWDEEATRAARACHVRRLICRKRCKGAWPAWRDASAASVRLVGRAKLGHKGRRLIEQVRPPHLVLP